MLIAMGKIKLIFLLIGLVIIGVILYSRSNPLTFKSKADLFPPVLSRVSATIVPGETFTLEGQYFGNSYTGQATAICLKVDLGEQCDMSNVFEVLSWSDTSISAKLRLNSKNSKPMLWGTKGQLSVMLQNNDELVESNKQPTAIIPVLNPHIDRVTFREKSRILKVFGSDFGSYSDRVCFGKNYIRCENGAFFKIVSWTDRLIKLYVLPKTNIHTKNSPLFIITGGFATRISNYFTISEAVFNTEPTEPD